MLKPIKIMIQLVFRITITTSIALLFNIDKINCVFHMKNQSNIKWSEKILQIYLQFSINKFSITTRLLKDLHAALQRPRLKTVHRKPHGNALAVSLLASISSLNYYSGAMILGYQKKYTYNKAVLFSFRFGFE